MSGNLRYKTRPLLINSLTVKDFGVITNVDPDTAASTVHLFLKKIGLAIPATVTGGLAPTVQVSKTKVGKLKSVLMEFNGPEPSVLSGYDNGFDIVKEVKNPGVLNDDWAKKSRYYGTLINALQTPSGGQIADEDKLTIEDAVITQVLADRGFGSREEAIVDAKRVYLVTLNSAVTDSVKFTLADGTTDTVVMGATMVASVALWNADTQVIAAGLMAFAKSATEMLITSVDAGTIFTIEGVDGGTLPVVNSRYIWLYSRDVNNQFHVQFNPGDWTLSRFNVTVIDNLAAATGNSAFAIAGDIFATVATNDDSQTYAAAINAETGVTSSAAFTTYGYAVALTSGNNKNVYAYTGVYELEAKTLAGTAVLAAYSGGGAYPSLTWEDVFREFSEAKHLDGLAHLTSLSQPAEGDLYNKITIRWGVPHATMHGASQQDIQIVSQDIYLKQGYGATSIWDDSGEMWENNADAVAGVGGVTGTFTADLTINTLMSSAWGITPSATIA